MLYHLSVEPVINQVFTPRIPQIRAKGENDEIKRICFTKNAKKCFSAMPNGYFLAKNAIVFYESLGLLPLFYLYELDDLEVPKRNKVGYIQLTNKSLVPDAKVNEEVWVINQNIVCSEKVFLLKDINFRIKEVEGFDTLKAIATKQVIEESISCEERINEYCLYSKEAFDIVKEAMKNEGLTMLEDSKIKITENGAMSFYYLKVTIPPGFDMAVLWKLILQYQWQDFLSVSGIKNKELKRVIALGADYKKQEKVSL